MPELLLPTFMLQQPQRNTSQICQLCSHSFSVTTRQHLCKRCFRFVCDSCSPYKQKVYKINLQHKLHRLCNICHKQSQILIKYIQINKITWGQDSQMCRIWFKYIVQKRQNQQNMYNGKRRKRQEFTITVQKFWESLNYSFRQLIGRSIEQNTKIQQLYNFDKKDKNKHIELYKNILQQTLQKFSILISKLPKLTATQHQPIFYIFVFFMIHASEQNAIILSKQLYQIISSYCLTIETISLLLQKFDFKQSDRYKIQQYLQTNSDRIIKSASINYLSVQISIQIIGMLFINRDIRQLYKIIVYLLYKCKQPITKNNTKIQNIQIQLLRNNQGLGQNYKIFSKQIQNQYNNTKNYNTNVQQYKNNNKINNKQSIKNQGNFIKQNQQLKIINKNQQQQIDRLNLQNKKLLRNNNNNSNVNKNIEINKDQGNMMDGSRSIDQADLKQSQSYSSYWQQQQQQNQDNLQQNSNKLIKKYRKKQPYSHKNLQRMSTKSQKLQKQLQHLPKKQYPIQQITQYQQIINTKNKQITNLKKQIQLIKQTNISIQQQLNKYKKQQIKINKKQQKQQNDKIKKQLQHMKDMNKQLLLKLKQLSNMLMDKQEQQVKELQKQSLEDMVQIYQEQVKDPNRDCTIF